MESQALPREVLNIISYQYFSVTIDVDHDKDEFNLIIKFPQVNIKFNMFFPIIDTDCDGLGESGEEELSKIEDFIEQIKNIKDNSFGRIDYMIFNPSWTDSSFSIYVSDDILINSSCFSEGKCFSEPEVSLDLSLLPQLINALNKYVAMLQKFDD